MGFFQWACLLACTVPLLAQVEQGVVLGSVADQSGARVGGATVTITNPGTGAAHVTKTDATGNFRSVPLRTGAYSVSVEAPGFKKLLRRGITLKIQDEIRLDLALELGATAEQITLNADGCGYFRTTSKPLKIRQLE